MGRVLRITARAAAPKSREQSSPLPSLRSTSALAALVAVGTAALYARAIAFDFVSYDDLVYVVDNPNLRYGLGFEGIRRAFLPYEHNWLPLTFLSLLVDSALFGPGAAGFHATNIALHAASSALLFAALSRMTGAIGASFFTAAVFAAHPLHVESVAWISERKDTLSGFFFAVCLWLYAREAGRQPRPRLAAVAIAQVLGLLAKPTLVTLPCVLLLLDYWPLRRFGSGPREERRARIARALREKLPLFAISALASAITWEIQRLTGAVDTLSAIPLGDRVENAIVSYAAYLRDSVWPTGLAVFYPHPLGDLSGDRVAGAALLLSALCALAFALRGRAPAFAVGWLWFLGSLVPMIGIVQVGMQARADRYMYLPLIGLTIALAYPIAALSASRPRARRSFALLASVLVALLAYGSHRQLDSWRDSIALYERALRVTGANAVAHYGLAGALAGGAELARVREQLEAALRARPGWSLPAERLIGLRTAEAGIARARRALAAGDPPSAGRLLEVVVSTGYAPPQLAELRAELARREGEPERAREILEAALRAAEITRESDAAREIRAELDALAKPAVARPKP